WSQITQHLPGRTDNEIKNYWHSHLKKKKAAKTEQIDQHSTRNTRNTEDSSVSSWNSSSRNSSFESSECGAGSSTGRNCSTMQNNLPKVLFSEWFSMDQFQGWDSGNSHPSLANSTDSSDKSSTFLDSILNWLLLDEASFGAGILHHETNNGGPDRMFDPEFKF
ncbi:hypothetical protein U1Q18_047738, partial [Sarracenia purpurea var. burkii]